ncbi:MAG TPA: TetR/AcrR family transcriptional regulator [Solirubrobacterales bacterium]|nr:TetR/AcrR family transcriptional regulator [Solirubrobacterales bacterium]
MRTPWGNADQLRERMLRPGPGMPRDEVARNQRERLFGAMVGAVATKGYEETTVADVLELSGVSRSAFYEHFRDKEECFLATFQGISEQAMSLIEDELQKGDGNGSWEGRARRALERTLTTIVNERAAAGLCFDGIYTAGEPGRKALEGVLGEFEGVAAKTIAKVRGEELPNEMICGLVGGAQAVIQIQLRRDEDDSLPGLADDLLAWALSYQAPPIKLRLAGRRPRAGDGSPPPFVAYSQAERIIRALAACAKERGYPAVTIAEIAARASISQATFYSHFTDKEDALLAALDSAAAQMLGVVMPASRRAPDWPHSVRAAIGALCAFGAAEPDLACLAAVESYAAGPLILDERDRTLEMVRALLAPGYELAPDTNPLVGDAVIGAIWGLVYNKICKDGPRSLPEVAPLASYMALAPFVGAERAAEIANGDGRAA